MAKYYVYKSKFKENCKNLLDINVFVKYLKEKIRSQWYISKLNGNENNLKKIWRKVIHIIPDNDT